MKSLSALLLSALCASTCFAQNKADSLKAAAIFNKSKEAYAHLKTYVDSGRVSNHTSKGSFGKDLIFKTAYNGTVYNFQCYRLGQTAPAYTLNRNGKVVNSWPARARAEKAQNFAYNALAGAGASMATSYIVPALIFPADFTNYNFFASLTGIAIAGSDKVNGQDCFKIKGQERGDRSVMVCLGKRDYLIRKIETETIMSPTKTEASLRSAIALGKKLGRDNSILETALKNYHEIGVRDSLRGHPRRPYTSTNTYLYFPIANGNVNPSLLRFSTTISQVKK